MKRIKLLLFSLGICYLTAFLGSMVTTPSINSWYQSLNKPSFNPPNFIFGPVWTILFTLMGISLYFVLSQVKVDKKTIKTAKIFFFLQLIFNFLWSFLFFYQKSPFWAYIDIIVLWSLIYLTMYFFFRISKIAGWLFLPYLIWVTFATLLNLAIFQLN